MSDKPRIRDTMGGYLDDLTEGAAELDRDSGPVKKGPMGCWFAILTSIVVALLVFGALYMTGVIDFDSTQTPEETAAPEETPPGDTDSSVSQESATPGGPVAENPTAVGQAVDAVVRPAIEEVYGDARLQSAPSVEAPIVSLQYAIPTNPTEGDGEKLRTALADRGASLDPANSEMDYHAGEEFMMLIDTGNPAYKSIRVSLSPDYKMIYVNADRSEG
ncbi:MAG: hypothetical protein RBS17_01895 [Coriobacteriia bacterium]|nr:hypothetical protein [Coriobacteriia bacterium]